MYTTIITSTASTYIITATTTSNTIITYRQVLQCSTIRTDVSVLIPQSYTYAQTNTFKSDYVKLLDRQK